MRSTRVIGLALVTAATIAGCSPNRAPGPRVNPDSEIRLPPGASGSVSDARDQGRLQALIAERAGEGNTGGYRIGPEDLLEIRIPDLLDTPADSFAERTGEGVVPGVAGMPKFAQGLRVSASGDVTLPHLGQVHVDGLTPTELEHDIGRRLIERGILRSPQVSVTVVEYRSRTVAVVGAVERPGVFPVTRPGSTVSDLIWAAGGPTKDAGRVVQLMPATGTGTTGAPVRLDLETLLNAPAGGGGTTIPVRPGDVISLGSAGTVQVQGWVDKPGGYPVTRGMRLSGAVAAAGGPLFPADRKRTEILRVLGTGEQQLFTVDLDAVAKGEISDVAMVDGDVVRVPASPMLLVPWGIWQIGSTVVRVGGNVLLF